MAEIAPVFLVTLVVSVGEEGDHVGHQLRQFSKGKPLMKGQLATRYGQVLARCNKIKFFQQIEILHRNSIIVECPSVFKILNILIFDGDWYHKQLPFNFLKLGGLSNLDFNYFVT